MHVAVVDAVVDAVVVVVVNVAVAVFGVEIVSGIVGRTPMTMRTAVGSLVLNDIAATRSATPANAAPTAASAIGIVVVVAEIIALRQKCVRNKSIRFVRNKSL